MFGKKPLEESKAFGYSFQEIADCIFTPDARKPSSADRFHIKLNGNNFIQLSADNYVDYLYSGVKLHLNLDITDQMSPQEIAALIKKAWDIVIPIILNECPSTDILKVVYPEKTFASFGENKNNVDTLKKNIVAHEAAAEDPIKKKNLAFYRSLTEDWEKEVALEQRRRFIAAITIYITRKMGEDFDLVAVNGMMDKCEKALHDAGFNPPANSPFDFPVKNRRFFSLRIDKIMFSEKDFYQPNLNIYHTSKFKNFQLMRQQPIVKELVDAKALNKIPPFICEPVISRTSGIQIDEQLLRLIIHDSLELLKKVVNDGTFKKNADHQAIVKKILAGFAMPELPTIYRINSAAKICEEYIEAQARLKFATSHSFIPSETKSAAADMKPTLLEEFIRIYADINWNAAEQFAGNLRDLSLSEEYQRVKPEPSSRNEKKSR